MAGDSLKSCPFCGGTAMRQAAQSQGDTAIDWLVICQACEATVRGVGETTVERYASSARLWNRRPESWTARIFPMLG